MTKNRRTLSPRLAAVLIIAFSSAVTTGQIEQFELRDQIRRQLRSGDRPAAIRSLHELLKLDDMRGSDWETLGGLPLNEHKIDEAIAPLLKAIELRFYPGQNIYNIAGAYALTKP